MHGLLELAAILGVPLALRLALGYVHRHRLVSRALDVEPETSRVLVEGCRYCLYVGPPEDHPDWCIESPSFRPGGDIDGETEIVAWDHERKIDDACPACFRRWAPDRHQYDHYGWCSKNPNRGIVRRDDTGALVAADVEPVEVVDAEIEPDAVLPRQIAGPAQIAEPVIDALRISTNGWEAHRVDPPLVPSGTALGALAPAPLESAVVFAQVADEFGGAPPMRPSFLLGHTSWQAIVPAPEPVAAPRRAITGRATRRKRSKAGRW